MTEEYKGYHGGDEPDASPMSTDAMCSHVDAVFSSSMTSQAAIEEEQQRASAAISAQIEILEKEIKAHPNAKVIFAYFADRRDNLNKWVKSSPELREMMNPSHPGGGNDQA